MGLDQYAFVTDFKPNHPVDFKIPERRILEDSASEGYYHEKLYYWRKHSDLHGWMEELYNAKGGQAESFNCVPVQLDEDDLDQLEYAIDNDLLPKTRGFFFGASTPERNQEVREFIAKARQAIQQGMTVYYDSWW